ncbi:MAG: recombination protein RecR, partial [Candidatus Omnitrophica bacterium]|nr:recombination protein RecR [Candidatus Omnitrophota bacterium]
MSRQAGYPDCMQEMIEAFAKMPGVGIRTAERLAFYVLGTSNEQAKRLSEAIQKIKSTIRYCKQCFNLSERELCPICVDPARSESVLCVVEEPKDIITIEKAGVYKGKYHVLLGNLSPLDGIGPEDIRAAELFSRVRSGKISEVFIATTSDTEGEATAIYLRTQLKQMSVQVSRLASGVPL